MNLGWEVMVPQPGPNQGSRGVRMTSAGIKMWSLSLYAESHDSAVQVDFTTCVCIYIYMYDYIWLHMIIYKIIHDYIWLLIWMLILIVIYMYIYIHTHTHSNILYIYIYIYICIYIYIYTYANVQVVRGQTVLWLPRTIFLYVIGMFELGTIGMAGGSRHMRLWWLAGDG